MNIGPHIAVSAAAGIGIAVATGDREAIGITMAAGVLPDADHLVDYYVWYIRRKPQYLILPLHGWEYLAAALAIYILAFTDVWMLSVVVGYATQLAGDQLYNSARWNSYLITVRILNGFRASASFDRRPADSAYEAFLASVPLYRESLRRWFEARVAEFPPAEGESRDKS